MVIINMAMMIVMIKMGIMMMVMIMMMIKCLQTQAQRSKITWPECLAHWQSAQSLSKAASRLRPFFIIINASRRFIPITPCHFKYGI